MLQPSELDSVTFVVTETKHRSSKAIKESLILVFEDLEYVLQSNRIPKEQEALLRCAILKIEELIKQV